MSAAHADQIVEGYIARLELALAALPATRRAELIEDVRSHIADGRAALVDESDAMLLELVERLGDPGAIAGEELERDDMPRTAPIVLEPRWGWLELAAVVLTVIIWPIGAILMLLSPVWTRREKIIGAGLGAIPFVTSSVLAPLLPMIIGPLVATPNVPPVVPMLFAVIGALPLVAAGYLALRLYRRASYLPGLAT